MRFSYPRLFSKVGVFMVVSLLMGMERGTLYSVRLLRAPSRACFSDCDGCPNGVPMFPCIELEAAEGRKSRSKSLFREQATATFLLIWNAFCPCFSYPLLRVCLAGSIHLCLDSFYPN